MKLICKDQHPVFSEWARRTIGVNGEWGQHATIALVEDLKILAVVVYNNWHTNIDCSMHVAAVPGQRWLTREFLHAAFDYPFNKGNLRRVTGTVSASNTQAQRFDEHLGFRREGVLRRGAEDGSDLIVYGMLREECRFLRSDYGQQPKPVS